MPTTTTTPTGTPLLVAGLDASTGGLEALESLFSTLAPTDQIAFVVHAGPDAQRQATGALRERTRLPVVPVADAVLVQPGHVYLVPPGRDLRIESGCLRLADPDDKRQRRPLDHLLQALAEAYGDRAAAVVAAGAGRDGTVGAQAVREAGGLVLIQATGRGGTPNDASTAEPDATASPVPRPRRNDSDDGSGRGDGPDPPPESERRLAAIFAHAAAGLCEVSLDGRFLRVNDALCRMLGRTRDELLAASVPDVTHPPDRPASERALAHVRDTGEPVSVDKRYARPDGTLLWASSSLTRLDDEEGCPIAILAVTIDLTERRRAERALRESEERLRLATEAARMGVWAFDVETKAASRSPRFYEIYGYTPDPDGATLDDFYDHVHPDDRDRVHRAVTAALGDESRYREEFRIVRPDGEVRWVHSEGQLVRDEAGVPVRMAGVTYDVTDRKRAEAALRESEARFREAAETVPDILFTATPDGLVDYVNSRLSETTGVAAEDAFGTPIWPHLAHPEDRGRAEAEWAAARREERPHENRYRLQCEDGTYRWHLTRARPIRDASGAVVRWFGTCTDIDDLVRAEQEVQALNATLEARVAERTRELSESEAHVRSLARDLAVAEQEERQRIALVLHDDLQQQLYGLGMTLSLLRRPHPPEAADRLFGQAEEILDGASALTRSLATELSPPVLSAPRLEAILQWIAEKHQSRFNLPVHVEVVGDPEIEDHHLRVMLYHALRELLFNVVKHANAREVRLRAWEGGARVVVRIEDDGDGFDVQAVTGQDLGARGLGLHAIRERAELVGGHIEIDAAPGEGTRVTIDLPRSSGAGGAR